MGLRALRCPKYREGSGLMSDILAGVPETQLCELQTREFPAEAGWRDWLGFHLWDLVMQQFPEK